MDSQQPQSPAKPSAGLPKWIVLTIILIISACGVYLLAEANNVNSNTNSSSNTGNSENGNVNATTNTVSVNQSNTNLSTNTVTNSGTNINSPDANSWNTYENATYGIRLDYPSTLNVSESTSSTLFDGLVALRILVPVANGDPYIDIYVVSDSAENVRQDIESREFAYYAKTASWSAKVVGGLSGEHARKAVNVAGDHFEDFYLVQKDDVVLAINTFSAQGLDDSAIAKLTLD